MGYNQTPAEFEKERQKRLRSNAATRTNANSPIARPVTRSRSTPLNLNAEQPAVALEQPAVAIESIIPTLTFNFSNFNLNEVAPSNNRMTQAASSNDIEMQPAVHIPNEVEMEEAERNTQGSNIFKKNKK